MAFEEFIGEFLCREMGKGKGKRKRKERGKGKSVFYFSLINFSYDFLPKFFREPTVRSNGVVTGLIPATDLWKCHITKLIKLTYQSCTGLQI